MPILLLAKSGVRILLMIIAIFTLFPHQTFAAPPSDEECISLIKQSLVQLRSHPEPLYPPDVPGWDGTTYEDVSAPIRPGKTLKGVKIQNLAIYCSDIVQYRGTTVTGITELVNATGVITIVISRVKVQRLEDYKAVVYHELIHAGMYRTFGETKMPEPLFTYLLNCEEALAHAKTLILLQELNGNAEFGGRDLTKSSIYVGSMTLIENYLKQCMAAGKKSDTDLGSEMRGKGLTTEKRREAIGLYRSRINFILRELQKIKLKVMEKKIEHLRDKGLTAGENMTLEEIRRWLNVSSEDYRTLYTQIAAGDLRSRVNGTKIDNSSPAEPVLRKGASFRLLLPFGDTLSLGVVAENNLLHVREGAYENSVSISERSLLGIFSSLDKTAAVKVALARGEISIAGSYALLAGAAEKLFRLQYLFAGPFSEGSMIPVGQASVPISRAPTGVRVAKLPGTDQALVLDQYGGIAGCTTSGAIKLAEYKPEQLTPSACIYLPGDDSDTYAQKLEKFPDEPLKCGGG